MSLIYIRQAQPADIPAIMPIIAHAKAQLKASGSPQWQDGYPNESAIATDIDQQNSWILLVDGQIAGTAALIVGDDPNYHQIDGAWANTTDPYATIHRIALGAGFTGKHLSHYFFSNLLSVAYQAGVRNFRVDTHAMNQQMQALATSLGYQYRGLINANGVRRAYELNLTTAN